MAISFDKAFGIHVDALAIRNQRAQLIAENMANADTPNYKARDIDFRALLANSEPSGSASSNNDNTAFPSSSTSRKYSRNSPE